jgi:hypothetical protein
MKDLVGKGIPNDVRHCQPPVLLHYLHHIETAVMVTNTVFVEVV